MAKVKEILKLLRDQISSTELDTILSASNLNDVEVTEEGFKDIKEQIEGLLTVESAQTNEKVKKSLAILHKKSHMTEFETKLAALADKLDIKTEYQSAKHTDDKIAVLLAKVEEVNKPLAPSEDKEALKKYKKDIADLNAQIAKLAEDKEAEISTIKTGFETERVKNAFKSKLSTYKLAEAYQKDKIKNSIFDDAFNEVSSKAILKFDEKGDLLLFDKETPDKPYYIKNKPGTINDLVDPILKDYLQVTEPPKPQQQRQQNADQPVFAPGTMGYQMARDKAAALNGMVG